MWFIGMFFGTFLGNMIWTLLWNEYFFRSKLLKIRKFISNKIFKTKDLGYFDKDFWTREDF